jgi:hypothetical protein
MAMNSKIPGISLIQDTSEWFSVVERPQKEHPAVSFSQIMMRAGILHQLWRKRFRNFERGGFWHV